MRKIYTLFLLFFCVFASVNGQDVELGNTGEIETVIELVEGVDHIDIYNYIKSNADKEVTLSWGKELSELPENWETTICFGPTCYGHDVFSGSITIPPMDSVELKASFTFFDGDPELGSGEITFFYYSPGDSANVNGNVTFKGELVESTSTDIEDLGSTEKSFQIYPNPAKSFLNLELQNFSEVRAVEIYNMVGQSVLIAHLEDPSATDHRIDLIDLAEGIYFVSLLDDSGMLIDTRRFSKAH